MNADLRKAAILLASLDAASADRLLARMDQGQAKKLREAVLELSSLDPAEQARVAAEFRASRNASSRGVELELSSGSSDSNITTLAPSLTPARRRLEFVPATALPDLKQFLVDQHPQLAALLLSQLAPSLAAELLASLASASQRDLVQRLAALGDPLPEVLDDLESEVRALVRVHLSHQNALARGRETLDEIARAGHEKLRGQITPLLETARETIPAPSRNSHPIRESTPLPSARFALTFEEFVYLDDASLAAIFSTADPDLAMLALVGASATLVKRIEKALPPAMARQLRKRLEEIGPVRLRDIERAQQRLLELAETLREQQRVRVPAARRLSLAA